VTVNAGDICGVSVFNDGATVDISDVTVNAGAISGVSTINDGATVDISDVTVNGGAVSGVTTISTGAAQGASKISGVTITNGALTDVSEINDGATVDISDVTVNAGAISGVSEINDGATVDISDVTVNAGAISGVTTINAAAALTLSAAGSTTTVNGALTVTQAATFTADMVGSDVNAARNVFATTTGTTTLGGGAVNIGAAGSTTTVDGALSVTQAATYSSSLSTVGDLSVNTGSDVFKVTAADGNVVCAGTVTAGGSQLTSDARWKTNVVNVTGALDAVLNLRPVYYDWRADSPAGRMHSKNNATAPLPREVGFLAQEVREALPREGEGVVGELDEAGHLGLSYSKLTAVLVGAVQEQQHTIDAQEQTIVQLQQAVLEQREAQRRTNAEHAEELRELWKLVNGLLQSGR